MTRTRALFIANLLALVTIVHAQDRSQLEYTFVPEVNGPKPVLHVNLVFTGNSSGTTHLILPTTWAGQRDLFKSILNLRSLDSECKLTPTDSPGDFLLRYPSSHKVRIAYDLTSDWTGELRYPKNFRPLVKETGIIFNGQNGLVHPDLDQNAQVRASFTWNNLPAGWNVASSFGSERSHESFRGQWHEVYNALFAAGDFRFTHVEGAGERITLAARGSWIFSDRQATEEIVNIFRIERAFWGERKRSSFLAVLTPYDQDLGSSDGSVFTNAFLLYLSRKQTFLIDEKSILAHEIFHAWNPFRMGLPSGQESQWFTEGFTHYYQDRILFQAKLIDAPQYFERLNKIVATYWSSPDRNWTQKQWLDREETHNAEYELPYARGAMIALWVDQRIRQNTAGKSSLDETMLSLLQKKPVRQLNTDFLLSFLSEGMSKQDAAALRSFVEMGITIPLPESPALDCGILVQADGAVPHYALAKGKCGDPLVLHIRR